MYLQFARMPCLPFNEAITYMNMRVALTAGRLATPPKDSGQNQPTCTQINWSWDEEKRQLLI